MWFAYINSIKIIKTKPYLTVNLIINGYKWKTNKTIIELKFSSKLN